MIPASFEYLRPTTVQEAIGLLRQHGDDAKVLAGGHSLLPMMKLRLAQPKYLVDIGRVPGLAYIRESGGNIAIGAMTTHTALEQSDLLRAKAPLVADVAAEIADVQVRNLGTIGGSLAHADPAADLPAACLALDAEMVASGPNGERTIKAENFFTGLFSSALHPGELLTEIRFPAPPAHSGGAYSNMPNPASHFAVVGVAAQLTLDGGGRCQAARIGVTGVSGTPFRAKGAEIGRAHV